MQESLAPVTLAVALLVTACTPLQSPPPAPLLRPPQRPSQGRRLRSIRSSPRPPRCRHRASRGLPGTPRAVRLPTLAAPHLSIPLALSQLNGVVDSVLPDPNDAYGLVLEDLGSGARTSVNDRQVVSLGQPVQARGCLARAAAGRRAR